jgi:hypothetical protein
MTRARLDVASVALGAGAIVAGLLKFVPIRSDALGEGGPVRYSTPASVSTTVLVILLVAGALAVIGGLLGGSNGRWLAVLAGAGLGAVAVLVLVQNIAEAEWLDGSRSAMALLGGLGIGLLAVGLTPRPEGPGHA